MRAAGDTTTWHEQVAGVVGAAREVAEWRLDVIEGRTELGLHDWLGARTGGHSASSPVTVGELIERLSAYPSDQRVLIDVDRPGLFEVSRVVGPHDSVAFVLPTLISGAHFDCRSI